MLFQKYFLRFSIWNLQTRQLFPSVANIEAVLSLGAGNLRGKHFPSKYLVCPKLPNVFGQHALCSTPVAPPFSMQMVPPAFCTGFDTCGTPCIKHCRYTLLCTPWVTASFYTGGNPPLAHRWYPRLSAVVPPPSDRGGTPPQAAAYPPAGNGVIPPSGSSGSPSSDSSITTRPAVAIPPGPAAAAPSPSGSSSTPPHPDRQQRYPR